MSTRSRLVKLLFCVCACMCVCVCVCANFCIFAFAHVCVKCSCLHRHFFAYTSVCVCPFVVRVYLVHVSCLAYDATCFASLFPLLSHCPLSYLSCRVVPLHCAAYVSLLPLSTRFLVSPLVSFCLCSLSLCDIQARGWLCVTTLTSCTRFCPPRSVHSIEWS
jgi:hypothetical protein